MLPLGRASPALEQPAGFHRFGPGGEGRRDAAAAAGREERPLVLHVGPFLRKSFYVSH